MRRLNVGRRLVSLEGKARVCYPDVCSMVTFK